jgi:hypothetical protein
MLVHYEQTVRPHRRRIPVHYEQTVRPQRWRIPVHYEQTVTSVQCGGTGALGCVGSGGAVRPGYGKAVQLDPIKPMLKAPGIKALDA